MKLKVNKEGMLEITTEVFQTKNGAIHMNFSNTTIKLSKDDASIVAYDIPDFDLDAFNQYYN